jgi:hypothetical protein
VAGGWTLRQRDLIIMAVVLNRFMSVELFQQKYSEAFEIKYLSVSN